MTKTSDVIVVGAGMIGATIAWRCAQRGLAVIMVDSEPARGAWQAAAGMLAPITELHYTETPLLRLNLESIARYPKFVDELTDLTAMPTGFRKCGTVSAAWDSADLTALRDLRAFLSGLGLHAELLTGRDLRRLEPALASGLPGGLLAGNDHQVDPRLLHEAIAQAARMAGVEQITARAEIWRKADVVAGVQLEDGRRLNAPTTVLAAGAWSGGVGGIDADIAPPVRPVKGQTLRLRLLPAVSTTQHVIRGCVKGAPIYLVPRSDGRLIVGASSEEAGFDVSPRAGAVYELLRDAQSLLPELSEAVLEEICTGLRPATPDNAPIIGPAGPAGLIYATGHYRNGVLLAPVTADAVADLITTGHLPEGLHPFAATRWHQAVSA